MVKTTVEAAKICRNEAAIGQIPFVSFAGQKQTHSEGDPEGSLTSSGDGLLAGKRGD